MDDVWVELKTIGKQRVLMAPDLVRARNLIQLLRERGYAVSPRDLGLSPRQVGFKMSKEEAAKLPYPRWVSEPGRSTVPDSCKPALYGR